jgi:hypothetical protein
MSLKRPRRAAFFLLVLVSLWVAVLGTSLIWIVVGVCKYYGMELKGGDWIQAAASLTGVGAAVFIANSQMRREIKQSEASAEVALTALVKISELSQHYVEGLYKAVSPNCRSQWHVEQVQSLHRTLMSIDLLTLPDKKLVEYVIQLRGMLEYALHSAEQTVNLYDNDSALAAKEQIGAAAFVIQGVVVNLKHLVR